MSTIQEFTSTDNGISWKDKMNTNFSNLNADLEQAEENIQIMFSRLGNAGTGTKGLTKLSSSPVSPTNPIAVGDNDSRIPTQDENNALSGTSGTPSSSNKFVTAQDTNFTENMKTSGTQTIAGIKTFSNIPLITDAPTSANDMVNKTYVDTAFANL